VTRRTVISVVKELSFPLGSCISFPPQSTIRVPTLAMDPAYLHSVVFSAQFFFDMTAQRSKAEAASRILPHFTKTVSIVRQRVEQNDVKGPTAFLTLAAVMALANHANWAGDTKAARTHVEGLHAIADLMGGLHIFSGNPRLQTELVRYNWSLFLHLAFRCALFLITRHS
jgi:hypothetical protein